MPAIADIDSVVTVTPADEIQVIHDPGKHVFIDDRSPFSLKVSGVIKEKGQTIGVYGRVIQGHERYQGLVATLLVRLDHSNWSRDNRSAAQFKVGQNVARPNGKHPFYHPEGTDMDGYPRFIRYGSIDSRTGNEPVINSALEKFHKSQTEQGDATNGS